MILLLPLISAFLHPLRDFILKAEKEHRDAIYILMLFFWSFYGLILTLILKDSFVISSQVLVLCVISAFGNLIYFAGIARALRDGEFSVLYPIIRSTPFVIAFFKWAFFGFSYKVLFLVGIFLVVYGVVSIQSGFLFWRNFKEMRQNKRNIAYAILALIGGVIYYIADDKVMTSGTISPNTYLFYNFGMCALMFVSILFFRGGVRKEAKNLCHVMREQGYKPALAGLTGFTSYLLIMFSLKMGADVVLTSALRLWGIPFAMLLGIMFLKERNHITRKLFAVIIIFMGSLIATFNK